ncbi:MAG TPA: ABC transporter permease [Candidatus Micrarchaeia archaeon]|nr:ABC transporter permease [Candidatus Micrarchaeia archaeon]
MRLTNRWKQLFLRRRLYSDLSDEIREHLDEKIEELVASGMSDKEAAAVARRQFGNITLIENDSRAAWQWPSVESFFADVRYAMRTLRKSPGFAVVVIATLALGIGANSTIFSWINSTVLNPIPGVKHANQYVEITSGGVRTNNPLSYPDYVDLRDRSQTLSGLLAASDAAMSLTAKGKPERIWGMLASTNYFDALDVRPILGRSFLPSEADRPGGAPVAIISYHLWQTHFGANRSIIGQTIEIDRHPFEIIGIAPRDFVGTQTGLRYDLWVPLAMVGDFYGQGGDFLRDRGTRWLLCIGRLKPGVTAAQSQAEMNMLMHQISVQFATTHSGDNTMTVHPLWRAPYGANYYLHTILFLLLAISGVVLLLACANVANLLLVRSVGRRREMAIRLSIGATRGRLIRQLLAESLLLSVCGGGVAMLFTLWSAGTLSDFVPPVAEIPLALTVNADHTVLLATLLVSILAGVVFGILPALRSSNLQPVSVLKEETGSASGGMHRARLSGILVVAQIAMSLLLLVSAGLFIRSVRLAEQFNPGFNPHHVLLDAYDLRGLGYDFKSGTQFHRQVLDKLRATPGIQSVTLMDSLPLGFGYGHYLIQAEGYVPQPHEPMDVEYSGVGPDYLRTMQIPLVSGREFADSDLEGSQLVALVNAAFAQRYWPHEDALGKKIHADGRWRTVVGVAQNSDYDSIGQKAIPFLYLPLFQEYSREVAIAIRVQGDPLAFAVPVQDAVHSLDPDLPLFDLTTLESRVQLGTTTQRMGGVFVGAFAIVALILAAIGIYGMLAYTTRQRTLEIGIRMALGASPRDVLRLVLRQGLKLALLGLSIGLVLSFILTRALAGELFGVSTTDPLTYLGVALLLLCVALAACAIPTYRAMRTDPMTALRYG